MDRTPIITAHPCRRVAVDLTPVLPGGENGGAKVMTLELLRLLAQIAPAWEFVLLTLERNHQELSILDAPNMTRLRVDVPSPMLGPSRKLVIRLRQAAGALLPAAFVERLSAAFQGASKRISPGSGVLRSVAANLLFSPFTAPTFYDPSIPLVAVVYDLQHLYYPEFFDPAEVQSRDRTFREACRVAASIVCISSYVRDTVLANAQVDPRRVEVIPILLSHRLPRPSPAETEDALRSLELTPERFLLYPANFWRHKNHEALLEAFRLYLDAHPASDLKLVLTGAPGPRRDAIAQLCRSDPVLASRVEIPGYLAAPQFSGLLYACGAIIFPSLFEGFGMPVLEGMAAGKPLLAANVTSLPEVAGDAALYFDAHQPSQIAEAIARLEHEPDLRRTLSRKSAERLKTFGAPADMAAAYLKVFSGVLQQPNT
jgi:glycosyltransferase involved in cell wall biosynthesis